MMYVLFAHVYLPILIQQIFSFYHSHRSDDGWTWDNHWFMMLTLLLYTFKSFFFSPNIHFSFWSRAVESMQALQLTSGSRDQRVLVYLLVFGKTPVLYPLSRSCRLSAEFNTNRFYFRLLSLFSRNERVVPIFSQRLRIISLCSSTCLSYRVIENPRLLSFSFECFPRFFSALFLCLVRNLPLRGVRMIWDWNCM